MRTTNADVAYGATTLPSGIRSRFVDNHQRPPVHVLEAGFENRGRPCVLLLHGFPGARLQLAQGACCRWPPPDSTSWRPTSAATAAPPAGTPTTTAICAPFALLNLVRDALGLVSALGHRSVAAVVGHDFGSPVAAWCALVRPDVFRRSR